MLFNSFQFVAFFVTVTAVYFNLPARARALWLLLASCYFYMAFIPAYLLILVATIVVDYFLGLAIATHSGSARRTLLALSIVVNISFLGVFKYFNFISDNVNAALAWIGYQPTTIPRLDLILPIGLSFHTFQAMSYTIEVYRGTVEPERSLLRYALYVMFYPQLVAGPIERPQNILHQLHLDFKFDAGRAGRGLKLMIWGVFKKVVIADRLAVIVDTVYSHPQNYVGFPLILATLLFAFQIYCDFSGYSDIAIGAAEVMGVRLMQNFRRPYFSSTVSEFWKRWHISLSTWFKDYLYIPLGGSRGRRFSVCRNLLLVFLVSGLWHGANWTFVVWGLLNGALLVIETLTGPKRARVAEFIVSILGSRLSRMLGVLITFTLICVTWVWFRAQSSVDALYILTHWAVNPISTIYPAYYSGLGLSQLDWLIAFATVLFLFWAESLEECQSRNLVDIVESKPALVRWGSYYVVCMVIICFGVLKSDQQFIYFQF